MGHVEIGSETINCLTKVKGDLRFKVSNESQD
jgi:hypothetical protein